MQEKWDREKKVLELRRIKWYGEIWQLESDMWLGGCENKLINLKKGGIATAGAKKREGAF